MLSLLLAPLLKFPKVCVLGEVEGVEFVEVEVRGGGEWERRRLKREGMT